MASSISAIFDKLDLLSTSLYRSLSPTLIDWLNQTNRLLVSKYPQLIHLPLLDLVATETARLYFCQGYLGLPVAARDKHAAELRDLIRCNYSQVHLRLTGYYDCTTEDPETVFQITDQQEIGSQHNASAKLITEAQYFGTGLYYLSRLSPYVLLYLILAKPDAAVEFKLLEQPTYSFPLLQRTNALVRGQATIERSTAKWLQQYYFTPAQADSGGSIKLHTEISAELVRLANAERAKLDLPDLTVEPHLTRLAGTYARFMAEHAWVNHRLPSKSSVIDRFLGINPPLKAYCTQNIACFCDSAESTHQDWMAAEYARDSICSPTHRAIGVAAVSAGKSTNICCVQLFSDLGLNPPGHRWRGE